jgi:hypothetical protein
MASAVLTTTTTRSYRYGYSNSITKARSRKSAALSSRRHRGRHDEVKIGFGIFTRIMGITWTEEHRKLPSNDAPMRRSVYDRFDLPKAFEYDAPKPFVNT